jgi:hypothetical protein
MKIYNIETKLPIAGRKFYVQIPAHSENDARAIFVRFYINWKIIRIKEKE